VLLLNIGGTTLRLLWSILYIYVSITNIVLIFLYADVSATFILKPTTMVKSEEFLNICDNSWPDSCRVEVLLTLVESKFFVYQRYVCCL
jgi:hypothetical protein